MSEKTKLLLSVVIGLAIMAFLNAFMVFGARQQNDVLVAVYYILMVCLWAPVAYFFHDREVPIVLMLAVGLFDVFIFSGFAYIFLSWRNISSKHNRTSP